MRAWVEIDKENLKYNIKKLQELAGRRLVAIIKANAYGLGDFEIAKILKEADINFFGVANVEEGLNLRKNGIEDEILVLGLSFEDELLEATKNDLQITVSTIQQLKFIKENNLNTMIHLKVDTGMTRIGFDIAEVGLAVKYCRENNLNLMGIYTHLSSSGGEDELSKEFTFKQLEKFKNLTKELDIKYIHISNSAGLTNYSDKMFGTLSRIGLGMYGFIGEKKNPNLKNVYTLKSKILFKKEVKEDSLVSYDGKYKLLKGETYAVLPIGYEDGMKKYLSNGGYVIVKGIKCDIIGKICMDMTMIKIPREKFNEINVGDEVKILDIDIIDSLNIDGLCAWNLMTGLGNRVKRIYK